MAGILMKIGGRTNANICEYCVDTVEEVAMLPTAAKPATGLFEDVESFDIIPPIGSTCIVGNGSDDLLVYMLFSNGWKLV